MKVSTLAFTLLMKLKKAFGFEASSLMIFKIWSKAYLCWCEFLIKSHKENLIGFSLNCCSRLLFNFYWIPHYVGDGGGGIWFGILGSSTLLYWFWPCLFPFPLFLYWCTLIIVLTIPTKSKCFAYIIYYWRDSQ